MENYNAIDKASLIHIISFIIIGLIIKNNYKIALLISLSWETIQYILISSHTGRELLRNYWPISEKYWNEQTVSNRIMDVIFDMIGYFFS
mgnify:CR=1 FL=1